MDRFWKKVQRVGCWLWLASKTADGYGQFKLDGRMVKAHRLAFVWSGGIIPDGMELDHRCRVRHCVNPAHLEPVTHAENNRRSRRDSCRRGHPLTEATVYVRPDTGTRQCLVCTRERLDRRPTPKGHAGARR